MLVLTRKEQEQIRIGDSITITIVRIKGNTVRVGIEAPRDVHVVRSELAPLAAACDAATSSVVDLPDLGEPEFAQEQGETDDDVIPEEPSFRDLAHRRALVLAIRSRLVGASG